MDRLSKKGLENVYLGRFSWGDIALLSLDLFLFSDVSEQDAPTRIRLGSHLSVARLLSPIGEEGISMLELASMADTATSGMPELFATGAAGTVYDKASLLRRQIKQKVINAVGIRLFLMKGGFNGSQGEVVTRGASASRPSAL